MDQILAQLDKYIDITLLVIIILAAYWAKTYLCNLLPNWRMSWKVLIFSTIVTIAYYMVLVKTGVFKSENVPVYIITYFAATSFYELFFSPLEGWIKKITGKLAPNDPKNSNTQ